MDLRNCVRDQGGKYGAWKNAYGIEYGLSDGMGSKMVTNWDWLMDYRGFMDESWEE